MVGILKSIYSKETKTSAAQLALDFGGVLPFGSESSSLNKKWSLVRARGIGLYYIRFKIYKALFQLAERGELLKKFNESGPQDIVLINNTVIELKLNFPRLARFSLPLMPFFFDSARLHDQGEWRAQ